MIDTDPFTLVYDALWSMLDSHTDFQELVKKGNMIRFSGKNRDPVKAEISVSDVPEVRLVPMGGTPHLQRTSNSSSVLEKFEIQLSSGDQRVDYALFPVKWAIYRAMSDWATILEALTWKGRTFVKLARPMSTADGVTESDLRRGIDGWASIWSIEVHMWFANTDVQGA